ncbi:MAG TPA: hypothetical protein VGP82_07140 [Ktedonobacterales bacterium]|nr:hypothetical protein [Ktedonobacterales bacterium]
MERGTGRLVILPLISGLLNSIARADGEVQGIYIGRQASDVLVVGEPPLSVIGQLCPIGLPSVQVVALTGAQQSVLPAAS